MERGYPKKSSQASQQPEERPSSPASAKASKAGSRRGYPQPKREELVLKHAPLVRKVAYRIMGRLPGSVDIDDLISAGTVGLLKAMDRYDPDRGPFEQFAEWRIKGAMLDELRVHDHLTRTQREKVTSINRVRAKLNQELGREATIEEIAEAKGCSVEEASKSLQAADTQGFVSLEDLGLRRDEVEATLGEMDPHAGPPSPMASAILAQTKLRLVDELKRLPEREQMILSLYYVEGLNYREIGAILDLTESRICQVVKKSLLSLRKRLKE